MARPGIAACGLRRPGGPRSGFQVAQQLASSGACISETPFARAYCRAVSGTSPRAMQMASRAPRRSRSACNSRKGSTPTRAAFQRRAPTMATWPSLLRAKSAPGACRRSTSQPSRWKPANRAGKIRPGHRGGGLRHGLHARFGRRAQLLPGRHDGDHGERDGGEHAHGRVLQRQRGETAHAQQRRDGRADPPGRAQQHREDGIPGHLEFHGGSGSMGGRGGVRPRRRRRCRRHRRRRRRRAPRCAGRRYRRSGRRGSWRSCGARPRRPR